MPRIGRLHIAGGYYHVLGRGLERRTIFNEVRDKRDFLARLSKYLNTTETQCLAWAIMPNHYHLLVRVGDKPLAKLMAPLLGGYAGCYNRRHQRVGYVFQNRYKSILCDADAYLLELIRYIHLNPLRAGLVPDLAALDRYPWTGHASIMGKYRQPWYSTSEVLGQFGNRLRAAIRAYRRFLRMGVEKGDESNLTGGGMVRSYGGWENISRLRKEHILCIGDERILGGSCFVESSLRQDEISIESKCLHAQRGWNFEKLSKRVCEYCRADKSRLHTRARGGSLSKAKSLVCYWGVSELGFSMKDIARELSISRPAVSVWFRKGEDWCEQEQIGFEEVSFKEPRL